MRKLTLFVAAFAAMFLAVLFTQRAEAFSSNAPAGLRQAAETLDPVDTVSYHKMKRPKHVKKYVYKKVVIKKYYVKKYVVKKVIKKVYVKKYVKWKRVAVYTKRCWYHHCKKHHRWAYVVRHGNWPWHAAGGPARTCDLCWVNTDPGREQYGFWKKCDRPAVAKVKIKVKTYGAKPKPKPMKYGALDAAPLPMAATAFVLPAAMS